MALSHITSQIFFYCNSACSVAYRSDGEIVNKLSTKLQPSWFGKHKGWLPQAGDKLWLWSIYCFLSFGSFLLSWQAQESFIFGLALSFFSRRRQILCNWLHGGCDCVFTLRGNKIFFVPPQKKFTTY